MKKGAITLEGYFYDPREVCAITISDHKGSPYGWKGVIHQPKWKTIDLHFKSVLTVQTGKNCSDRDFDVYFEDIKRVVSESRS